MFLKEQIKQFKYSGNLFKKLIFYTLKPCWIIVKLITHARLRAEFWARFKNSKNHYQISTFTQRDRYPLIFKECKNYLQNVGSPKILSFGCSTGEEVKTLGEYLPAATIVGVDMNNWCIKQCRKNNHHSSHFFYHRLSQEFQESKDFDVIFCMAVFQKTENRINKENNTTSGFSFEQFEKEIMFLNDKLKTNGLLIIDHADFNFTDTAVAAYYKPLEFEHNQLLRKRPLFNRDNIKIADEHCSYRMFVKSTIIPSNEGSARL